MQTPSMAQLISDAIEAQRRDLHVALPGRVETYNFDSDTIDVQPMIQRKVPGANQEHDAPLFENLPVIPSVPIVRPRGNGFFIGLPVVKGDFVLLLFCERDIGQWRATGQIANPGDQRMHGLSGAVAIPGLFPRAQKINDLNPNNLTFGKDGGLVVTMTQTTMEVDGNSDAAALASQVVSLLNTLKNAISAAPTAMGDGGAAFKAAILNALVSWPTSPASTKLKVGG